MRDQLARQNDDKENSRWIQFASVLAICVLLIGIIGVGISGYVIYKRNSVLAPLDSVTDTLSGVSSFTTSMANDLQNIQGKVNSASNIIQEARDNFTTLANSMPDSISVLGFSVYDLTPAKATLYNFDSM